MASCSNTPQACNVLTTLMLLRSDSINGAGASAAPVILRCGIAMLQPTYNGCVSSTLVCVCVGGGGGAHPPPKRKAVALPSATM